MLIVSHQGNANQNYKEIPLSHMFEKKVLSYSVTSNSLGTHGL